MEYDPSTSKRGDRHRVASGTGRLRLQRSPREERRVRRAKHRLDQDGRRRHFPGRSFSQSEHDAGAQVVIINDTLKARLFGESDPIGKQVDVEGKQFLVIGVFHTKAGFLKTLDGRGPDKPRAILPMMTAYRHLDVWRRGLLIMTKPRAGIPQSEVMDAVTELLRGRRDSSPAPPSNFALVASDRMMETFDQLFGAIFMVGLALSAVALMVGGVGVVAIMMISVTEHTTRLASGKRSVPRVAPSCGSSLVEAATLTSSAHQVGLVIGAILAWIVRTNTPVPTSIPPSAVITAIAGSVATGVVLGMLRHCVPPGSTPSKRWYE